jgi:hypothetical protein
MNNRHVLKLLIISTLFIIILSTSAMAYSRSSMLSHYKPQPAESQNKFNTTENISNLFVDTTSVPSPGKSNLPSRFNYSSSITFKRNKIPSPEPIVSPSPTSIPSPSNGDYMGSCPTDVPVGELHHCLCVCSGYKNTTTGETFGGEGCINPETGWYYPIGRDALGNSYVVKPGCQAKWAD